MKNGLPPVSRRNEGQALRRRHRADDRQFRAAADVGIREAAERNASDTGLTSQVGE
jgi:hypothetical protein